MFAWLIICLSVRLNTFSYFLSLIVAIAHSDNGHIVSNCSSLSNDRYHLHILLLRDIQRSQGESRHLSLLWTLVPPDCHSLHWEQISGLSTCSHNVCLIPHPSHWDTKFWCLQVWLPHHHSHMSVLPLQLSQWVKTHKQKQINTNKILLTYIYVCT